MCTFYISENKIAAISKGFSSNSDVVRDEGGAKDRNFFNAHTGRNQFYPFLHSMPLVTLILILVFTIICRL
jgi:hypothetical protein